MTKKHTPEEWATILRRRAEERRYQAERERQQKKREKDRIIREHYYSGGWF